MNDDDLAEFFARHLSRLPLMAILRGFDPVRTVELCHRAWDCGIELVEIPVQSPAALEGLRRSAIAAAARGSLVGAGTVVSAELVRASHAVGASFTVAPGLDPEVVAASREVGLPHLPGVATPSEVHRAMKLGMNWLKAFPAAQLGIGWADAIHGPFPGVHLVATGGISASNAEEHLAAGAAAVSLTSAISDDDQFVLVLELVERLRGKS